MARATRQRKANDDGASDAPPVKVARTTRSARGARTCAVNAAAAGEKGEAKTPALDCGIPPLQVPLAQRAQWDEFLCTKCLMRMGADFFDLFELAASISSDSPLDAFVETLGIRLCGPFDLLAHAMHANEVAFSTPLFLHGRYFLDPPEVTTVLKDAKNGDAGAHWGYFRDSPEQTPSYVVYAESSAKCSFQVAGASLFDILDSRIQECIKAHSTSSDLKELATKVKQYLENKYPKRTTLTALTRKRSNEATAPSLHQLGIVVPYDAKKETGFRELPVKGVQLEELIEQVRSGDYPSARKKLSGLITRATIATDECDFGTSLLLGLELFTAGAFLEKESLQLLRVAYMLLRRMDFFKIAAAHATHRRASSSATPTPSNTAAAATSNAAPLNCIITETRGADHQVSHVADPKAPKVTAVSLPSKNPN
ncbi:hypothetical protein FI667_g14842, partial [Globisporangium splendens]